MPALDVYHITDQLDDTVLDVISARLEERGKHPAFAGMMRDYIEAMDLDAASDVLDLGCGTGVAARFIARRDGFDGSVLGIDQSAYLTKAAEQIAAEEGMSTKVRFETGDTQSLNLADAAFDAVVAHTLLSHVDDPGAVLAEAKRVVKPGGRIGVFDGDYASITFEQEDTAKAQADDNKLISAFVTQPRVMRRMPRLAKQAGLELVASFPYALAEMGRADFFAPAIESFRTLLPKSGAMSEAESNAWIDAQLAASKEGVFFGASNFYGYVLKRPS